jgi:hypothetical protein
VEGRGPERNILTCFFFLVGVFKTILHEFCVRTISRTMRFLMNIPRGDFSIIVFDSRCVWNDERIFGQAIEGKTTKSCIL